MSPMRTTATQVTFTRPFSIGSHRDLAPGTYDVETDEEPIESLGHTAYVRTATMLFVKTGGETSVLTIDPVALANALAEDMAAGSPRQDEIE